MFTHDFKIDSTRMARRGVQPQASRSRSTDAGNPTRRAEASESPSLSLPKSPQSYTDSKPIETSFLRTNLSGTKTSPFPPTGNLTRCGDLSIPTDLQCPVRRELERSDSKLFILSQIPLTRHALEKSYKIPVKEDTNGASIRSWITQSAQ